MRVIPFNRPFVPPAAYMYLQQAVANGHLSGDGPFTHKCHQLLQELLSVPKVLLTTSCTHALEMSALLLDIQPGDEVLVPSFTFVSTVNAFVLRGARPVFVDIRPDTLNLDEEQAAGLVSPRTRVVVPVHYAGIGCAMDRLVALAKKHQLAIVEDNAHGFMGKYQGKHLGTFGALSTLSFHETKNFNCGEGGALLINDPAYAERAEIIREKGTNRSRFFRGMVDKYTWVDVGSSFLPSDALAALLYAQLLMKAEIQARRRAIWERYRAELDGWATQRGIRLPTVPDDCDNSCHLFYLLLPTPADRTRLIDFLGSRGVKAVFHYLPLHLSPMGTRFGFRAGDCPVTESVSDRLIRLPIYHDLSDDEQMHVISSVKMFRGGQQHVDVSLPGQPKVPRAA